MSPVRAVRALQRRLARDQSGFTLVEMLVAIVLAGILGGILMTTLLVAQNSSKATTAQNDVNVEARDLLNRLSRDLRQALPTYLTTGGVTVETPAINSVQNPFPGGVTSPATVTSITFQADFDGDGCVAGVPSDACPSPPTASAANPEVETFCWSPTAQMVYLVPGGVTAGTNCQSASGGTGQPMLSGKVTGFQLTYYSNQYLYDANGDGVTDWTELDAAGPPVGNKDGVLDAPELDYINGVKIEITVSVSGRSQNYLTQVDLRNVT